VVSVFRLRLHKPVDRPVKVHQADRSIVHPTPLCRASRTEDLGLSSPDAPACQRAHMRASVWSPEDAITTYVVQTADRPRLLSVSCPWALGARPGPRFPPSGRCTSAGVDVSLTYLSGPRSSWPGMRISTRQASGQSFRGSGGSLPRIMIPAGLCR
jgi:hypothetical protein